jgi:hypothetical protein
VQPPHPPAPPPHPAPPPAPPPRRSNTKIIIIVVASVLAVCCLIGGIVGFFAFRTVQGALGPPREATEAFLRDLIAGDSAAAYAKLCRTAQSRHPQAEVTAMINERRPTGYEIGEVSVQNVNGVVSASVTANLTYADGFVEPHTFLLRREDDTWKVCGNPY